ncbi:MAG: ATP-binding protein [Desulfuromonadales bacterium]|nr:ATP-binding protein [Desulfuromonadales bacterium]
MLQRNFSLEQLKTEFDGFAGDLARNVRDAAIKVSSNSELLKEQCGQALDEKAHFLTENICLASAQMLSHAGAIIELTETATTEVQRKRVELDLMARRIADSLMTIHNERSLEFSVDADMTAWCDPEMMQQIIYNLFSSAISFIPNNREGVIKFGKLRRDNRVVYYVRDNGNGYGAEQAKVIFNPFRDSKQDPALPEDTIRLAIARRLVIRHGGKIWAEGVPGAGGAVFFTDYPDAIKNA